MPGYIREKTFIDQVAFPGKNMNVQKTKSKRFTVYRVMSHNKTMQLSSSIGTPKTRCYNIKRRKAAMPLRLLSSIRRSILSSQQLHLARVTFLPLPTWIRCQATLPIHITELMVSSNIQAGFLT